jgi:hypothetical protein
MRILLESTHHGWINALTHLGHEVAVLDRPAFDVCDEFRPDLLLMDTPTFPAPILTYLSQHVARIPAVSRDRYLPAFDSLRYPLGRYRPELACRYAVIESRSPELDRWVTELLESGAQFRLFGPDPWPIPQYLGELDDQGLADLCVSADTVVNFRSRENPFLISGLGGCCLEHGFACEDLNLIPWKAQAHINFRTAADRNQSRVLRTHTYLHRVSQMFDDVDYRAAARAAGGTR